MRRTHSYVGTLQGNYKYAFYMLFQDYIQEEQLKKQELEGLLERFARNLGHESALVRPFRGDVETVKQQIGDKDWTESQLKSLSNTPGFLMLNVSFDDFDPRFHNWIYLSFRDPSGASYANHEMENLFGEIIQLISVCQGDVFKTISEAIRITQMPDMGEVFEIKPGILGCSINLFKAKDVLIQTLKRLTSKKK